MHPHEVAVSSSMEMIPVCPSGSQVSECFSLSFQKVAVAQ